MPFEGHQQEEHLEAIEHMFEQLKAEMRRLIELRQQTIQEARLTRLRAEEARLALQRERGRTLERQRRLAAGNDR